MDAPLYNALCALRGQKGLRMHMPGHKGKSPAAEFSAAAALDYTEIDPTGNLYTGEGPIAAAEALAVSIAERAGVDMPYMTRLFGKSEEEILALLQEELQISEEWAKELLEKYTL